METLKKKMRIFSINALKVNELLNKIKYRIIIMANNAIVYFNYNNNIFYFLINPKSK